MVEEGSRDREIADIELGRAESFQYAPEHFKAAISRKNAPIDVEKKLEIVDEFRQKVGLVSSRSRSGRAAQSLISIATPGDMGDVRSPVRSTVAETLTPGGGGGGRKKRNLPGRIGGASRAAYRCPAGFENGGKFTNRLMNTCGLRIFDAPDAIDSEERATSAASTIVGADIPRRGTLVTGGGAGRAINISRAANIATVSKPNKNEVAASVANSIAPMSSADRVRLVRRDGTIVESVTSIDRLLKIRNTDDVKNGVFISSARNIDKLGYDEVDLLKTGAQSVVFAMPDGKSSISLSLKPGASDVDIRKMSTRWKSVRDNADFRWTGALEQIASDNPNILNIEHIFPDLKDPADALVEVQRETGETRTVRRWIFEMFMAAESPARPKNLKPWTLSEVKEPIPKPNET